MAKKNQTEYEKQRDIWYKKLDKSGFKDIEQDENHLKRPSTALITVSSYRNKESIEAKIRYYSLAEHFLNEYKFENNIERMIWEYHSNGLSARDITKILKSLKKKANRDSVWRVIKRLRTIMYGLYNI